MCRDGEIARIHKWRLELERVRNASDSQGKAIGNSVSAPVLQEAMRAVLTAAGFI